MTPLIHANPDGTETALADGALYRVYYFELSRGALVTVAVDLEASAAARYAGRRLYIREGVSA